MPIAENLKNGLMYGGVGAASLAIYEKAIKDSLEGLLGQFAGKYASVVSALIVDLVAREIADRFGGAYADYIKAGGDVILATALAKAFLGVTDPPANFQKQVVRQW
jgi:hypothetical protein